MKVLVAMNLPSYAADPANPTEGMMYYNSTTKTPMIHNGTAFVAMVGSSSTSDDSGMMNSMGGMY